MSKLVIVESQSRPDRGFGADSAGSLERLENPLQVVLIDADSGIFERKLGDLMMIADLEGHMPGIGELDCVGQQIDQDLA